MVKSVLNKFLERENCAKSVSDVIDFAEKTYNPICLVDNVHVCGYDDDQVSDEDGLVMNVISHPRNGVSLVKDKGQEHGLHGSEKSMHAPDKKRKSSVSTDDKHVVSPCKRKTRKQVPQDHVGNLRIDVTTRPAETESDTTQLTDGVTFSKKCRDLVNQKGSATSHISDVLTNHNFEVASSSSKKVICDNASTDKESEKVPDIQPIELIDDEDEKSSRGATWLQKSSWLQLVGDTANSSFNLAQILPDVATSEKQESQQLHGNDVSSSTNKNQQKPVPDNQNHPVGDNGKFNSHTIIANLDPLTKDQYNRSVDGKEDATSAPMPVPDIVISDTCPLMRSAASLKEWAKMKSTLSVSRKKGRSCRRMSRQEKIECQE